MKKGVGVRRKITAVILAVLVFSLIAASAASLNGINTADLGADATVVAACDSDGVDVDYNWTYTPGAPGFFDVDSVVVSAIEDPGCDNYDIYVELGDGTNVLGSGQDVVSGGSATVTITPVGTEVDAELVTEIGIVISNG